MSGALAVIMCPIQENRVCQMICTLSDTSSLNIHKEIQESELKPWVHANETET